ncbi:molybdenum cofactor cytidylyltransferase [Tenacibaculum adriaticum]|uniref:Molybdenum cofactor cytidylyltransferase n=1 Tax=Tenacibaculum adriaticum TaxID=413713 RepID=A0A5S5E067_9FLAO|nr:nucleotidyltransferase family protein [Tenacibaculum adriaticum]TYQ00150.1 molybdenum cofactor cytidylyltransferase [Tenacibaculum adriaticum]
MNIAILILAAGSSSRMGTPKQLLPIGNSTLLGITINTALNSNASKVLCVLGANAEKIKSSIKNYNIETVLNINYKNGISSSIISGIEHLIPMNFDAVLIMLGDQPNVGSEYLNSLIQLFLKNPKQISASNYDGKLGVPAIFPKTYFEDLKQLSGDKGARNLLNSFKVNSLILQSEEFIDIDTIKEYQDFISSIKK